MKYGYARISTGSQSADGQIAELRRAGYKKIIAEIEQGDRTDRPKLRGLLAGLKPGDEIGVTRLDRLARSTRDLLNMVAAIGDRKATFKSLADTWADTTTPHGRLILTVIGGLAEFEKELIRARTTEGRARAKARGVKLGRKPKLTPHQRQEARRRKATGEPHRDIALSYAVHNSTISRL
jgi:DNA invertase Pin-like site-specific DNA recombinase